MLLAIQWLWNHKKWWRNEWDIRFESWAKLILPARSCAYFLPAWACMHFSVDDQLPQSITLSSLGQMEWFQAQLEANITIFKMHVALFQNWTWVGRNKLGHLACQVFDQMLPMDLVIWQALWPELQSEISLKWFTIRPFTLKDTFQGFFKSFPKSYHLSPSDFPNSRYDWSKLCITRT